MNTVCEVCVVVIEDVGYKLCGQRETSLKQIHLALVMERFERVCLIQGVLLCEIWEAAAREVLMYLREPHNVLD